MFLAPRKSNTTMKSLFGDTGSNDSCSCTSCFNDLDSPSLRRLLAQESRTDRLFNGNKLPLRESKLIEKLIKTRALYDDIRNQLLSSSLSISSKSDLKPRHSSVLKREVLTKTKRAGNIFQLVDLLDKGSKKISECCSCCSCHSKHIHLNKHVQKGRKHAHAGGYATSKSSVLSKSGTGEEFRLRKSFKTKNIKSDPCTCACESHVLKELIKLQSRVALKKIRPEQPTPAVQDKYHSIIKDKHKFITLNNEKLKDSYHKLKRAKIQPSQYPDDMGEGGGKAVIKLNDLRGDINDTKRKKSVEQFRLAQSNERDNYTTERKDTHKHKENTTALKNDSYLKKVPAIKIRDQVNVKRKLPTQNLKLKQKIATRPRKSNLDSALKNKIVTSSTSTISIRKERGTSPVKTGIKKQKIRFRKPSKINILPDSHINGIVEKNLKDERAVADRHPTSKVKEIAIIPREKNNPVKSMTDFLPIKTHTGIENTVQKPITVRHIVDDVPMRFVPTRRPPEKQITIKKPVKSISTNTIIKKVSQKNVDTNTFENDAEKSSSSSQPSKKLSTKSSSSLKHPKKPNKSSTSLQQPKKPKKSSSSLQPPKKSSVREKIPVDNKNLKFVKKNRHVGRHNLKRCFCTLKLKVKDTTSKINKNIKIKSAKTWTTQSVQTMILSPVNKKSSNTIDCEYHDFYMKTKKKSEIMYLSRLSNTRTQTSTPSKFSFECECPDEDISFKESQSANDLINNIICECPSSYQNGAIQFQPGYTRIHSSNKSKSSKEKLKMRDMPKHLKHKQSQISDSTRKSKFTITKHGLRKCVCTFKIGKTEKKKKLPVTVSKGTSFPEFISRNSKTRPSLRKVSKTSETNEVNNRVRRNDECAPGFCIFGECNPKKCKEVLTQREGRKKRLNKRIQSTVQYQKPKSTGGFICRSLQLPRAKKIHPLVTSHRSEVTIQLVKKIICKNVPDSSSYQVRPSFAIKFLKKHSSSLLFPFMRSSKIEKGINTQPLQDQKLKENKRTRKSILMGSKKHDNRSSLGPTMKRCLLLVLHKGKHKTTNSAFRKDCIVVVDKKHNSFKNVAKIVKPKSSRQLKPYECQPFSCIPNGCDPYECTERMKKRNIHRSSREFGMITQKAKMVSKSSDTRKLETQSKDFYDKPEFKQQFSGSQRLKKISKYSHLPQSSTESYSEKRGIRLNSNFSFNIEFSKEILTENDIFKKRRTKNKVVNMYKYSNDKKFQCQCYQVPYSTAKIKPILKKCLCTFKEKKGERRRSSQYCIPFIAANSQVYAVNTVIVSKNKLNSPERKLLHKDNPDSSHEGSYSSNYTKKALSRIKLWQYLKKEKASSVFSISTIAYTSAKTYVRQSKCQLLQSHHNLLGVTSEETLKFESKFRYKVKHFKSSNSLIDIMSLEQHKQKYVKENTINAPKIIKQIFNNSQLTGIQPLLKKCYCTMNIQVATQQNTKRRRYQHKPQKLLDYECEPEVCVPYECDPHECQKMIMKRLMRKVSRISGTERRLKNSSSLTSNTTSSSKHKKLQSSLGHAHAVAKTRPIGVKYQTLPRPPKPQKQAVRVGSVFSFDIEFSKNTASPASLSDTDTIPKYRSTSRSSKTHRKDRGTGGSRPEKHHRESQSMMKQLRDRASSITPMIQRCFCTLKLQKKGKLQKEKELQVITKGTSTPIKFQVEKPILRTIETGQNIKIKKKTELLPYECEPNICVPGECDPYACLELIKKRRKRTREFGTESMAGKLTSSSSMTSRTKKTRQKSLQSRNIRVRPIKSRDTAVISKPSLMSIDRPSIPSRQAVRIGSSFNFNIEFYKDHADVPHMPDRRLPESFVERSSKHVKKVPKHVHARRKTREKHTQERRKTTRDVESQISLLNRPQSTVTSSILKRCFCTLKLHDTAPKQSVTDSMLKRCLCTLKTIASAKKINDKHASKPEKVPKKVISLAEKHVVQTQTRKLFPVVEPYECEPGVCVPGLCDPYECRKIIRKRNVKEKIIGTTGPKTRSTSSFMSSKTSKALMAQPTHKKPYEYTKKPSLKEIVVKEPRSPVLPGKQAVKIGSSFSFNIEFYKDNLSHNNQVQKEAITVKKTQPTRYKTRKEHHKLRTRDRGLRTRELRLRSRESQLKEVIKKDKSFGPMLKRCFCTLKLNRKRQPSKPVKKNKSMHRGTATPSIKQVPTFRTRSVMTRSVITNKKHKPIPYKLEPYECEPGICVPGECDPHECKKRIKKRLIHRGSATLAKRHRTRSNMVKPRRIDRDSYVQSLKPKEVQPTKVRRPEYRSTVVARPSRQAVKAGSNFSFNIEFYKDRSPNTSIPSSKPIKRYPTYEKPKRTVSRSTDWRSISSRNKVAQHTRAVRDIDSQVLATKMRTTMTGVGPFLKRCFCTLQLYKSQKDGSFVGNTGLPKTKIATAKATTSTPSIAKPRVTKTSTTKKPAVKTPTTKTQIVKPTADEIPAAKTPTAKTPAVKTPAAKTSTKKAAAKSKKVSKVSEAPNKDVKHEKKSMRIHKKSRAYSRKLEPYECEPGVCIPGQCDPYECEKRIKRRMLTKDSSTLSRRLRSVSCSIAESKIMRPRTSQAKSYTRRHRKIFADRCPDTCPNKKRVVSDTSPSQQVVRIGSSFSFNIEFFKDRSTKDVPDVPKIQYKPHKIKGTETKYKTKSVSSYGTSSRQRDCHSQSDCIKYSCKGSCARLKRCFCTLKLQKKGKLQQPAIIKIEPTTKTTGTHTAAIKTKMEPVAREVGTKTKKYSHFLEPYECEPGVCIPGLCDPYECEKRIKLRHMKTFGTETTKAPMKSMSISTFKDQGTKQMNTQLLREKKFRNKKPSTKTLYRAKRSPCLSPCVKSTPRQSVRLGSSMSFNIEFFKDRSSDQGASHQTFYKPPTKKPIKYKSKTSVSTANGVKLKSQGSNRKGRALSHRISQVGVTTESKGSGVGPLLKRCFCTLTLQRAEVKNTMKSSIAKPKAVKVTTQEKSTSTKKKYETRIVRPPVVPQNLEPYECEPNVCIPGQCDPYECLERIKRRGIRRTSRTTGTRMKRPSQVSVSSMAAQFIPGYRSKMTQDKVPRKVERIVEEPRFTFLPNARRQSVKISSNFSFNIEFFREMCPEMIEEKEVKVCKNKDICGAKNICMECKKTGPGKHNTRIGQHDARRDHLRSLDSQSEAVRTEDKSSAVAMLRRCFCTAKLHKGHLARMQHPQSLIVGRVEEFRTRPIFGPKEYCVQYLIQQPYTCKNFGNNATKENNYSKKNYEGENTVINNNSVNLETIMSYTASKFNNIKSKTSFNGKINKARCSICQCNFKFCPERFINRKNRYYYSTTCSPFCRCGRKFCRKKGLVNAETALRPTTRNRKFSLNTIEKIKEVNTHASIFTKILGRWKHLFAKNISQPEQNNNNRIFSVKKANQGLKMFKCQKVREPEKHEYRHKDAFSSHQTGDGQEHDIYVQLICPHCRFIILQALPNKNDGFSPSNGCRKQTNFDLDVQKQNIKERECKDSITLLYKSPKNKCLKNLNIIRPCACCGKKKTSKSKGASYKLKKRCLCVCNAKKRKRIIVGVTKKRNLVKPRKIKPCFRGRAACKREALSFTKCLNGKLTQPKRQMFIYGTELCAKESQEDETFTNKYYKRAQETNNSTVTLMPEARRKDPEFRKNRKFREICTKKTPKKYTKISDVLLASESVLDIRKLGITRAKYVLCNVFRAIFKKRTYKNLRMYLGDTMRACKKYINANDDVSAIPTLKRYKLRSQAMSCSKESVEALGHVCNFHSKYPVNRGKLRPRQRFRRRLNPGDSYWLPTLSQRKEPWVTKYYKCAWIWPRCLFLFRVWRQLTDVLFLVLAVVLWCPCVATMELCKVMMFSCTCRR